MPRIEDVVASRVRNGWRRVAAAALVASSAGCTGGSGLDAGARGLDPTGERRGPARTNIVWIVADMLDPAAHSRIENLGGGRAVFTDVSALARDPAAARAVLLTGVHPRVLGLDEETGRLVAPPAAGIAVLPERLRRAGYYTSRAGPPRNNLAVGDATGIEVVHVDGGVHAGVRGGPVPVDDLAQPGLLGAWDAAGPGADWRGREKDWESPCTVSFGCGGARSPGARPFFALFNLDAGGAGGGKDHEGQVVRIVEALEADALLDDTVIFLVGAGGPAPSLAARWPAHVAAGAEPDDPVSLLDLAPTALVLAGLPAPDYMQGRVLVGARRQVSPEKPAPAAVAKRDAGTGPDAIAPALVPAPLPVAATPDGYPTGGLFHVAPRIDLRCGTEGATIVYTTERAAPFHWRLYDGPFRMRFWTLRFQCGRLGYRDSDIVRYDFDIE